MNSTLVEQIAEAERLIRPHVRETPVLPSPSLSEATGNDVWLKCENLQVTGSFKIRGATNRMLTLAPDVQHRGVVAASSGNHGLAVAHACNAIGIPATVYVPEGASPVKVAGMRRLGATVIPFGTDGLDTEVEARRQAEHGGQFYASPYNDLAVVAGQGSIGVELLRQLGDVAAVIVAVGGGGMIAGIGAWVKHHAPDAVIVGAQPANSRVMHASVNAGHVVDLASQATLSDGTAGGVETDTVTFPLCRDLVDEWVDVPEEDIASGMRHAIEVEHLLIEGAAAVAIAAARRMRARPRGKVAIVLCGANVSAATLRTALQGGGAG